jgi:hypothetical protein
MSWSRAPTRRSRRTRGRRPIGCCKAIANPHVNVIGHPTGRIINRRKGLEPAMDEIIAAAVEHDVALEINAHWLRLDLRDTHVRAAVEAGCLIAIDCDVHQAGDFDNIRYGVQTGGGVAAGRPVREHVDGEETARVAGHEARLSREMAGAKSAIAAWSAGRVYA